MTNSMIYQLFQWSENEEDRANQEKQTFHYQSMVEKDGELSEMLDDQGKKLFKSFKNSFVNHFDELSYESNVQMLNMGIYIGLELAAAFRELEE